MHQTYRVIVVREQARLLQIEQSVGDSMFASKLGSYRSGGPVELLTIPVNQSVDNMFAYPQTPYKPPSPAH